MVLGDTLVLPCDVEDLGKYIKSLLLVRFFFHVRIALPDMVFFDAFCGFTAVKDEINDESSSQTGMKKITPGMPQIALRLCSSRSLSIA